MTITERDLVEALLTVSRPQSIRDDPGATVVELAAAVYGNVSTAARHRVAERLREMLNGGQVARGTRYKERIDGILSPVSVFRLVEPKKAKR